MSEIFPWDVVLVPFPFTDLTQSKLRPAVVISRQEIHRKEDDYTLLFISSVIPDSVETHEVLLTKNHPEFSATGLKKDSLFKTNKIATVRKILLKKRLGKLGSQIQKSLQEAFHKAVVF